MRLLHNVVWGVLTALWIAFLVGIAIVAIGLFSAQARADVAEMGGWPRLLGSYTLAALAAGLALGVFRPIAGTVIGRHIVGGVTASVALATVVTLMIGFEVFRPAHQFFLVLGAGLLAGAALTPLWYHGFKSGLTFVPDFDSWLRDMVHTATISGSGKEPDDDAA